MEKGDKETMEELNGKYEDLKKKMEEFFDDDNARDYRTPPMVKSHVQPTREEYERHQTTHTPYAAWCKHCVAARAVRHGHPSKGRKAIIVPDIETGKGAHESINRVHVPTRTCRQTQGRHVQPTTSGDDRTQEGQVLGI